MNTAAISRRAGATLTSVFLGDKCDITQITSYDQAEDLSPNERTRIVATGVPCCVVQDKDPQETDSRGRLAEGHGFVSGGRIEPRSDLKVYLPLTHLDDAGRQVATIVPSVGFISVRQGSRQPLVYDIIGPDNYQPVAGLLVVRVVYRQ